MPACRGAKRESVIQAGAARANQYAEEERRWKTLGGIKSILFWGGVIFFKITDGLWLQPHV